MSALADIIGTDVATPIAEKVRRLHVAMADLPQYEPATKHWFAGGMYCREVFRHAGVLVIGRVHRHEHFYVVCSGRVQITTDDGVREVEGPQVIVSKPGTKRAVLALTDATCLTVHRTDLTDLDAIEAELIEPDDLPCLYDAGNKVKPELIEGDK